MCVCVLFSLNDCGWRSRPRNVPLEVVRGNTCLQPGGILYGVSAEKLEVCQDLNDYYALGESHVLLTGSQTRVTMTGAQYLGNEKGGFVGLAQCGYGTHTEKCGGRVVYVHADAPGGCEQTCFDPVMEKYIDEHWNTYNNFDYRTFCSDGGEGSRRVLFQMPMQTDYRSNDNFDYYHVNERQNNEFNYHYYDFACKRALFILRALL